MPRYLTNLAIDKRCSEAASPVYEFTFPSGPRRIMEWEAWSFETASFDRFIDLVEENSSFQDLVVSSPGSSAVYWLEA